MRCLDRWPGEESFRILAFIKKYYNNKRNPTFPLIGPECWDVTARIRKCQWNLAAGQHSHLLLVSFGFEEELTDQENRIPFYSLVSSPQITASKLTRNNHSLDAAVK